MARADLRATLVEQVKSSVGMGARIVLGDHALEGRSCFYELPVMADVAPEMPMFHEETFGPAAAVIHARDTELALANDSNHGHGGNLWTRDTKPGRKLVRRFEAGGVFLNGFGKTQCRVFRLERLIPIHSSGKRAAAELMATALLFSSLLTLRSSALLAHR